MSDLRISNLPAVTALSDTDVAPISQLGGSPTTRRATLAQLRPTLFDQNSVHVRDYGATGNGSTNDAPAIQAAINALKGVGGGVIRFGPRTYRLASAISIDGVAVRLEGAGFTEGPGPSDGTWLKVDTTGFTPITFTGVAARGSVVRDIAVTEVHTNALNASWAPNAYDWFFRIVDCLGGVDFDNVFLASVNKGFLCYNAGRTDFRRIRGQVFTCGIEIDQALDVPRLQNIHFWPFWSADTNVIRWQQGNGDALVFKRADGPFIDQAFALGYRSMFRFTAGTGGYTTKFYIGSGYADFCRFGVLIDSSGVNGLIANFTSQGEYWNASGAPLSGSSGIFVSGSSTHVQVGNLRIDTVEDNAIRLGGTSNRLDIFALRAVQYNSRNNAAPAIQVDNAASGTPNRVHLGTPPLLESLNANSLNNTDGNGVVQGRAPAGSTSKPGLAVGQDNSGLAAPSGQSLTLSANGAEMLRITQGGTVTLGAASGAHALEVAAPTGTVNRFQVAGAPSGSAPALFPTGGDSNIGMLISSKGAASITAQTGGGTQMQVLHQANAVNAVQLFGSPTGAPSRVGWQAAGTDANINAIIGQPKGSGALLAQLPDSAVAGGNLRGGNAVDLQMLRTAAAQVASGTAASIGGGQNNTAAGAAAAVQGGNGNSISGAYSWCPGGSQASDRGLSGKGAFSAGQFAQAGDAQGAEMILRRTTTTAATTALTSDGAASGSTNFCVLPNNAAAAFSVLIVGTQTGGSAGTVGDSLSYQVAFMAKRGASAAATTVSGVAVLMSTRDAGVTAQAVSIIADTSNGGPGIFVNGEANKTMQWVARVMSVETVR